ncbi:MAG: DUF1127 domain-containing protein [Roseovarius sp.]
MAVIDFTRSTKAPMGLSITRFISAFSAWRDARNTQKALAALSDRELEDIGLSRGDIASFTRSV